MLGHNLKLEPNVQNKYLKSSFKRKYEHHNTTWLLMCSHVVTQMVDSLPCDVVIDEENVPSEHVSEVVFIDRNQVLHKQALDKSNVSPRWATFICLITHTTPKWNVGIVAPL